MSSVGDGERARLFAIERVTGAKTGCDEEEGEEAEETDERDEEHLATCCSCHAWSAAITSERRCGVMVVGGDEEAM